MSDLGFPFCGFLVGALVGATGMGGGAVMTALLILMFGIHPVAAVGTDLLFAAATKTVGARVHAVRKGVDWRIVGFLALGSVPGTLVTLAILSLLPARSSAVEYAITITIAIALLFAASGFLFPQRGSERRWLMSKGASSGYRPAMVTVSVSTLTVALGFLLGIVVTFTSVGAGAIGLVILRQLHPNAAIVRLIGSDIAHAVPLTLIAGLGHWMIGDVKWGVLGLLLIGSLPGVIIGSRAAHMIPDDILRKGLGVLLLVLASAMLLT